MIDLQELGDHIIVVHITLWMTVAKNSIFPDDINKNINIALIFSCLNNWSHVGMTG